MNYKFAESESGEKSIIVRCPVCKRRSQVTMSRYNQLALDFKTKQLPFMCGYGCVGVFVVEVAWPCREVAGLTQKGER